MNERFTRSLYDRRNFSAPQVLRIGECAIAILERVAARRFQESPLLSSKDEREAVKKNVQAWWQSVQAKGERQVLIDGVEAGHDHSWSQAKRLIAKYPESAFAAIRKGATNPKNEYARASLIELTAKLTDKEVHAFLLAELRGPLLYRRGRAAWILLKRGDDAGVKVMLQEWDKPVVDAQIDTAPMRYDLAGFLVSCGKMETVTALTKDWRRFPVADRHLIAYFLSNPRPPLDEDESKLPNEFVRAVDAMLVAALDDEEVYFNFRRICDHAAVALVERWKQPNAFDLTAPEETRERQRLALKEMGKKREKEAPKGSPQK